MDVIITVLGYFIAITNDIRYHWLCFCSLRQSLVFQSHNFVSPYFPNCSCLCSSVIYHTFHFPSELCFYTNNSLIHLLYLHIGTYSLYVDVVVLPELPSPNHMHLVALHTNRPIYHLNKLPRHILGISYPSTFLHTFAPVVSLDYIPRRTPFHTPMFCYVSSRIHKTF